MLASCSCGSWTAPMSRFAWLAAPLASPCGRIGISLKFHPSRDIGPAVSECCPLWLAGLMDGVCDDRGVKVDRNESAAAFDCVFASFRANIVLASVGILTRPCRKIQNSAAFIHSIRNLQGTSAAWPAYHGHRRETHHGIIQEPNQAGPAEIVARSAVYVHYLSHTRRRNR